MRILSNVDYKPPLWLRYIDDFLCVVDNDSDLEAFLNNIKFLASTIKFTAEEEVDCSIPLLDCKVHRYKKIQKSFQILRLPKAHSR